VARAARGGAALALSVLLLAGVTGCGLSTNDEPEAIDDPVPEPADSGSESADLGGADSTEVVQVWFLRTDDEGESHLVGVERKVPPPATQSRVLDVLIQEPPTDRERDDGISTAIPDDVTLNEEPELRSDHTLIVELSPDFYDLQGDTARNAFAQVVFTATGLPGVDMVQFERDGEVFRAVDGEGQSREVLSRESYVELRPEPTDPA
jgi:spore germination protein GerM